MHPSSSRSNFKNQLKKSLDLVRAHQQQNLSLIKDNLSYAVGKSPTSFIPHLLRGQGNIPADLTVLETLGYELYRLKGFENQKELEKFLSYGGHPQAATATAKLLSQLPENETLQNTNTIWNDANHPQNNHRAHNQRSFIAGNIFQDPKQFFGREHELSRIFAKWNAMPMQHLYVEGPKGSGKTWLLRYLSQITKASPNSLRAGQRADWLSHPEQYRWIWINFLDPRNHSEENLLPNLLSQLGIPIPQPCTLFTFRNALDEHEWQYPTIVFMDEVSQAFGFQDISAEFWVMLRSLISDDVAAGNLAYVLAGHKPLQELADDHQRTSPVGNIYLTEKLGCFTESEASTLMDSSPIKFSDIDRAWILKQSRRWPVLLQILCGELLESLERGDHSEKWRDEGLKKIAHYSWLQIDDE